MKKVQLFLDLGNSETRGVVRANLEGEKPISHLFVLSNSFAPIIDSYELEEALESPDYNKSNSFAVNILDGYVNRYIEEGIYISGLVADNNFTNLLTRPTSAKTKHENGLVYLAIVKAIDYVINWLEQYVTVENLNKREIARMISFDLTLLVPPLQLREAKKIMPLELQGSLRYFDMFDNVSVDVTVENVSVVSEGLAGYLACIYSLEAKSIRQELYNDLNSRSVLVLDIGAGTTDVVAIKKGVIVETAKMTLNIGGNKIISKVRARYNKQNGVSLSSEAFNNVLIDANIKHGDKVVDVTKILNASKHEVSSELIRELHSYFESQNIDLNDFELLLVIGGGAISDGNSDSIATQILNGIQEYIPEITLVDTDLVVEKAFQDGETPLSDIRYLNLLGIVTLAVLQGK